MPRLVRLYIISIAIGFALAAVFTGLLIWLDVASVGHLIRGAGGMGLVAIAMLVVFFGILFSGVQFAIRIMMMAGSDDEPPRGRRLPLALRQVPVPAESRTQGRIRR